MKSDNNFSEKKGRANKPFNNTDLLSTMVDRSEMDPQDQLPSAPNTVPLEVISLVETANRLRSLDLPPARTAFRVVLRGKLLTELNRAPSVGLVAHRQVNRQKAGFGGLRFAVVSLLVLAFALGSAGTGYAAQSALPGDLLYDVKLSIESAQLALSSDEGDLELNLSFASRRVGEIQQLAELDRYDDVLLAVQSLTEQWGSVVGNPDSEKVKMQSSNAIAALTKVLADAPEKARPALENALKKISERQEPQPDNPGPSPTDPPAVPGSKPGENPDKKPTKTPKDSKDIPPGQVKKTSEP